MPTIVRILTLISRINSVLELSMKKVCSSKFEHPSMKYRHILKFHIIKMAAYACLKNEFTDMRSTKISFSFKPVSHQPCGSHKHAYRKTVARSRCSDLATNCKAATSLLRNMQPLLKLTHLHSQTVVTVSSLQRKKVVSAKC